jgi:hypothetical protein
MDDTHPKIAQKQQEIFEKKTPLERLEIGSSMHATSKYFVIRAILEENPDISNQDLRREFFLRFYGDDFDSVQKDKILKHIASIETLFTYPKFNPSL